jgi:cytochrome c-type biogenesis protein CcmH
VTALYSVAALLCAVALGILLWPLLRQRQINGRWSALGVAVAFAIVPVSFAVYVYVSNWNPDVEQRAKEGERLVQELAARLAKSPDDIAGWELLGRSYMALGDYPQGARAYREAYSRTPQPDEDLKLSFAEAQILSDRSTLGGDAGRMVEEVIAADPSNPKALWYGGLVALELGHEDDVKSRWSHLLAMNPPDEIANMLRTQLAALGAAPAAGGFASGAAGGGPSGDRPPSGPTVQLDVSLASSMSIQQLPPSAALFILARAPGGGPPLAVIRKPPNAVPGHFTLSDANSMIPGRSLADFDEVTLIARLSKTGQPQEQPGDWYAQTSYRPKEGNGTVALVIDQVVQ